MRGLEAGGLFVFRIDEPADLAVFAPSIYEWFLLEIKNPTTHTRGKGKDPRTEQQQQLHPEVQAGIGMVTCLEEAHDWIYSSMAKKAQASRVRALLTCPSGLPSNDEAS